MPEVQGMSPVFPPLSNGDDILKKLEAQQKKSAEVVANILGNPETNQELTSRAVERLRKTQRPSEGVLPVTPEIISDTSDPAILALREQIKYDTSSVAQQNLHAAPKG